MTTTFDPIELCDLVAGARKRITITPSDNGSVRFKAARFYDEGDGRPPMEITLDYDPAGLAAALSTIPGFTAAYEKPVVIPAGLGAVVEHDCVLFVRADTDESPWRSSEEVGRVLWHDDERIRTLLRDGAVVHSEGVTL